MKIDNCQWSIAITLYNWKLSSNFLPLPRYLFTNSSMCVLNCIFMCETSIIYVMYVLYKAKRLSKCKIVLEIEIPSIFVGRMLQNQN